MTDGPLPRLEVLKTLGDNTRYAIYLELLRSARPRTTAEVAEALGLHPNTVRPHLERMRDLDLVDVAAPSTGAVGRPQHRYSIAADAPSLGLEPPVYPLLATILLEAAAEADLDPDLVVEIGRAQGEHDRTQLAGRSGESADEAGQADTVSGLVARLDELGFDPAVVRTRGEHGDDVVVGFTHCPFRPLAEAHPRLVCGTHRGMVEGFVAHDPDVVLEDFHAIEGQPPCQVSLRCRAS